jgi:hypothetical protein
MVSAACYDQEQRLLLTVHVLIKRHVDGRLPKRVCARLHS